MSETVKQLRDEFGPFWDKIRPKAKGADITLNGNAAVHLRDLGRRAADELEAVSRERDAALARISRIRDVDSLAADTVDEIDRLHKQRDAAMEAQTVAEIARDNALLKLGEALKLIDEVRAFYDFKHRDVDESFTWDGWLKRAALLPEPPK